MFGPITIMYVQPSNAEMPIGVAPLSVSFEVGVIVNVTSKGNNALYCDVFHKI